ncbi:M23 family metallopeptidase [Streptacidiphilus monticola]
MQRALGAYCAATAVELVLPWLAGTGPGWSLLVAQTPAFAWYVLRTAPTHAVPPWFRWLALAPAAGGLFAGLRAWQLPWAARPGVLEVVFAVGVFGLAAWAWRRSRPVRPAPVSHPLVLRFPLRGGTFAFTEAGGPAVNRYADESLIPGGDRSRRYAADIVQLGDGPQWRGRRALGLSPTANNRYAVFGHPVHSPVDGVVLAVLDGLPDHPPRYLSAAHPDGNHVVIDTGRGQVVLAWLRRDSIRVQRGKHVTAGQLVGAVGNSGAGTEPGLHLRAETGVGLGLPFRFAELKGVPLRGRRLTVPE